MSDSDHDNKLCNCHVIISNLWALILILVILLILCVAIICADPVLVENVAKGKSLDVIKIAVALGRLDAITLLMTLVTVSIGIVAVFGYRDIKRNASSKASEVSKKIARRVAEEVARDVASRETRGVYGAAKTTAKTSEIDDLARTFAEENHNENKEKMTIDKFRTNKNIEPLSSDKDS